MLTPTTDFPLPLSTPRLQLRQPIPGHVDAPEYVKAVSESFNDLKPWMLWARHHLTLNQAERYINECCTNWITKTNNNVGLPLWIIDKTTSSFVGHIVMWNIVWDIPKLEIGFWVRSSCAGKGYITEATNALTRYCFMQLGVRRVEIRCEINNIRSQMIPKRLKFNLDGILRNNAASVATGHLTDTMVFSRVDLVGLPELEIKWGSGPQNLYRGKTNLSVDITC